MNSQSQVAYDVGALERPDAPSAPYARITLDAPRRRNALSLALLDELRAALDRAAHDDVRAVLARELWGRVGGPGVEDDNFVDPAADGVEASRNVCRFVANDHRRR